MTSIRLQARDMHKLERYVDAQYGGPGKGWYRIVTNPYQARRVVNQGKLAVVMGIETSVLFGCTMKADVPDPSCTKESIDRQLTQVRRMGVSQMELVNKFDNALSGVAGDEGQTGVAVNSANFLETGSFWDMRHCPAAYPADVHDKNQLSAPAAQALEDAFAARLVQFGEAGAHPEKGEPNGQDRLPSGRPYRSETVTIIGKPVRERDRNHLRFVASQPCLVCGRSPCDAHHIKYWSKGGDTSVDNAVLLCRHHHTLIHQSEWEVKLESGISTFYPPSWLDAARTPRRNYVHTGRVTAA